MNYLMVLKSLGTVLICESIAMMPSLAVALADGGKDARAFALTIAMTLVLGVSGHFIKPKNKNIYAKDGFAIVAIGWLMISFFAALPFFLSGAIPSFADSFFEASSGLTTTGATILTEVESLSKAILFWRSFTHWIGGMGVLVLTLAILPLTGIGSDQIMKAESPGPTPGKLVPKLKETAKILYGIYLGITVLEIVLLKLGGMSLYDAMIHTFGTVGTGGFSNRNLSVGAYGNLYFEIVIAVFMFLCGVNFSNYYQLLKGNIKSIFKDEELRLYVAIVLSAIVLITINLTGRVYSTVGESLRHSSFQVSSIITTTGYSTADFNQWPSFSKMILFLLMFVGGCAGSTGGGIKNIRILILIKAIKKEILKITHPRAVYSVKVGGKVVNDKALSEISLFFFMYIFIFIIATIIVSLDGMDMVTSLSSVAATIGNIGPGFNVVGPMGNFSTFSNLSKSVLSLCMIIGRLEIYPILLLFMPTFWRKGNI